MGISPWAPLSPPGFLPAQSDFSPLPGAAWLADVTCSQNPGAARPQAELGRGSQPFGSRRISYLGRAGVGREGSRRAPRSPQPSPCRRKGCRLRRVGKEGERRKMGSHGGGSSQIWLGWKRQADAAPGQRSDLRPGHFPRVARPERLWEPRDEITAREIQHLSRGQAGSGSTRQTGGGKSFLQPAALGKMFPLL